MSNGNVLSGDLSQPREGQLTVNRKGLEATVPVESVRSILFPVRAPDQANEKRLRCAVNTRRGNLITGAEPGFEKDTVSLTTAGGQRVSVPADEVVDMSFSTGDVRLSRRSVLAWGRNCDREGEYRNTIGIIRKYLPAWRIAEDFSELDDNFRKELMHSSVLLIPEMEKMKFSGANLVKKLKPMAEGFLRRGGRIVVLGVNNHGITGLMKPLGFAELELVDYNVNPDSQGATVPFTDAGREISRGVGDSFVTANSTYFFTVKDSIKAQPLAQSSSGAPIVGRKVWLDGIIIMGMDYHEHNKQTERILINALTYR